PAAAPTAPAAAGRAPRAAPPDRRTARRPGTRGVAQRVVERGGDPRQQVERRLVLALLEGDQVGARRPRPPREFGLAHAARRARRAQLPPRPGHVHARRRSSALCRGHWLIVADTRRDRFPISMEAELTARALAEYHRRR